MFLVGSLLIGLGIGQLLDEPGAGVLIGLGSGFILESIFGRLLYWGGRRRRRHD